MNKFPKDRDELRQMWEAGERVAFYFFYGHKPPVAGVDASCLSQWFVRDFSIDGVTYRTAEHWMMAEKARLFDDQQMLAEIIACETPKEAKAYGRKVAGFVQDVWIEHRFQIVFRGNVAKFSQHEDLKQFLIGTQTIALIAEPSDNSDDDSPMVFYSNKESRLQQLESASLVAETKASDPDSSAPSQLKDQSSSYSIDSSKTSMAREKPTQTLPVLLVEAAGRDTIWGIGLGQNNIKAQDPFQWRGLNLLGFVLTAVRELLNGI